MNIELKTKDTTIALGKYLTIESIVEPSDTSYKLKWISSDESGCPVTNKGVIYGNRPGLYTISAILGDQRDQVDITVLDRLPTKSISLNMYEWRTHVGQKMRVSARTNPIGNPITFRSLSESICSVTEDGLISANSKGNVDILVESDSVSQVLRCYIDDPIVKSLRFSQSSYRMHFLESIRIHSTVIPKGTEVFYKSPEPNKLSITSDGTVTTSLPGLYEVKVVAGDKSDKCSIEAIGIGGWSDEINLESESIEVPYVKFPEAAPITIGITNPKIVNLDVTRSGIKITPLNNGETQATISILCENKSYSTKMNISVNKKSEPDTPLVPDDNNGFGFLQEMTDEIASNLKIFDTKEELMKSIAGHVYFVGPATNRIPRLYYVKKDNSSIEFDYYLAAVDDDIDLFQLLKCKL